MTEKFKEVTDELYRLFGTDTGYIFGFPPDQKSNVEAIVKGVLIIID